MRAEARLKPATTVPFNEPHLALNRIYTNRGDRGETGLVGGQRVPKDAFRIDAYGTVDELNAFIGMAHLSTQGDARLTPLNQILGRVQHELFNLGSILATLPALRSLVLPGGTRLNTELHACRTTCRRAEGIAVALSHQEEVPSEAIQYLNRLSDALFVWSRRANHILGVEETLWQPNQAASGGSIAALRGNSYRK